MSAMLTRAAASIGLQCTPLPPSQRSRLDTWFLESERGAKPRPPPVPFFPEVHAELCKTWSAPLTARSTQTSSGSLTSLDGGAAKGYVEIPQVERAVAVQLCRQTAATWRNRPRLPSKAWWAVWRHRQELRTAVFGGEGADGGYKPYSTAPRLGRLQASEFSRDVCTPTAQGPFDICSGSYAPPGCIPEEEVERETSTPSAAFQEEETLTGRNPGETTSGPTLTAPSLTGRQSHTPLDCAWQNRPHALARRKVVHTTAVTTLKSTVRTAVPPGRDEEEGRGVMRRGVQVMDINPCGEEYNINSERSKPKGQRIVAHVPSHPSQSKADHRFPKLNVALFGNSAAVKYGCHNILLGQKHQAWVSKEIPEHQVSVINMIGLHETLQNPNHIIGQILKENGIHVFIFVVRLGQLTNTVMGIEWLQRTFGYKVFSFAMILLTYEREDECHNIPYMHPVLEKCGGRHHTCSIIMNNQSQMKELMDKIKQLFIDNNKQCYTAKMYNAVLTELQNNTFLSGLKKSIRHTASQPLRNFAQPEKGNRPKLSAKELMGRLHLEGKYQNLETQDFLQLSEHSQSQKFYAEDKFAHTFVQKLLLMDYRARCIKIKENIEQNTTQQKCNGLSERRRDAYNDIFNEPDKPADESNILDPIHLMDAQMAVFHCADGFLKQLIVTKLSQCQFALPLLVPSPFKQHIEFPLWTFRQIKKSWKTTDNKGQTISKAQQVYKAETPMVAFFRFGSVPSSKSQLINSLINEKHNTFFHRSCPGSSRTRILMDGVVEIAWYCPSGEKTDTFPQCVAFCNLHGDAGDYEKQLDIITQMSSVNVVILPQMKENNNSMTRIQSLYKESKPLICLLTENTLSLTEICQGKFKMGLRNRNQSTVFEELKTAVNNGLSSSESSSLFKLEDVAKKLHITVDEKTDEDCRRGKDAAQQMMRLLESKDLTEIKESFLPCQGKLWHQWCQKNKELHKPTLSELNKSINIEKNRSDKKAEMQKIREQQQTCDLSQFIQTFIKELNSLKEKEKRYFLKWLGILMDDYTTESISKHDRSHQLTAEQKLERISENLQAAPFGLEHILREVGQIYESCSSVKNKKKNLMIDFRTLPGLAAKMMMSGFPLELMDGDAAHVPMIWVTAVLDELIKKLGDKRVFVLSVLGIQSSGKSTMLNAMFGLQFAVSAGRCTRGAFMQLVKVSDEMKMKEQLKFDFILVVDTEGLRAIEFDGTSTRNHDNELATFVVGLGNMTLINIFGENTAEMQDTLQIVVQAFLRMKKVRLNPSCMFVHQNVSDVMAGEKNMEGRRRLQEKLDKMTRLAAKEENSDTEMFSDVIAFDVHNDVKYFSQLWEGSPPMAPPNPNYSRNIQELKDTILSKCSRSRGITLSQFKMRIDDLWTALLNENFVFSFKNTLEISIYRRLETKYSDWTWSLRSAMLSTEEKFYNRIANGNTEVHNNDLIAEIKTHKDEVEKSMKSYFDEDKDKDILSQWRGRFETQIKVLHDDLVKETKRKLDKEIDQKKAREKLDKKRIEFENMLFTQSKELALSLKSNGTDKPVHVLEQKFDQMWSKWVNEMSEDTPDLEDFNFWEDFIKILAENFGLTSVNERLNLTDFKQMVIKGDYDDYIIIQKQLEKFDDTVSIEKTMETPEKSKSRLQMICEVIEESQKILEKSPVKRQDYNDSYIQAIVDCVRKSVEKHQSENQTYKLKREFIIDLSLYVCDIAKKKFSEHHKKFRESNDPKNYLEKQKTQYYSVFKNYCSGPKSTIILIDFICSKLEPSILEEVYNKTAIHLAAQMRSDIQALRYNRSNLEKHILKSLAEQDDFKQYIQYIHQPKEHFKQFITSEVSKYFTEQSEIILNIFKGNLQQKEQIVSNAVHTVTEEVKNKGGDGNMWFRSFIKTSTDDLKFTGEACIDLTEITDLDFLGNHLSESLNEMMTKLRNSFSSIHDIKMEKCRKKPDEILIDHFCQCCWVQCPFCKAICTNTMEDHSGDHSVPFHRSTGLNGWFYRRTTNLSLCICTTAVTSDQSFHPNSSESKVLWKEYRKGGPKFANWSITPDLSELPYWKWFVCRFQKDLEKYYNKTFQGNGEIPHEWRQYTKEDAIESLDKYL
ncbi:interferon-induced very large GTPase 1-like [Triplophysa dalaica]|uniref:interferon-induced very large GTPase 1-like n=1 Tax=Triplophysa dalaica TaxID=1582913 RepID=UPI0024E029B7|nr:interferon-induced very large GTPase 1-like [Triplophysa dalaica]